MIYRFKIKDRVDSMRHQDLFFKLGYTWATGQYEYKYLDQNYLYVPENPTDGLTYSNELTHNPMEFPCKILQTKQRIFLEKILNDPPLNGYNDKIQRILDNGFYMEVQSDWLNKFRMFKIPR